MKKEALEATVFLGLAQLSTLVESTDEIENWTVSMAISYPVTRTQLTPRFRRVLHRSVGVYVQYGSLRTRRALWYFSFSLTVVQYINQANMQQACVYCVSLY